MFKSLKIVHPEHDVWAISDLHFGHDREFIYGPRGFDSVTNHDETLIHRWNEVCSDRSVVLNLGDFCFADPDGTRFKNLMRRLAFGTHYLLTGNHTSGARQVYMETLVKRFPDAVKDGQLQYEVYPLVHLVDSDPAKQVVFMPEYMEVSIGGHRYVLCHYPIVSFNNQSREGTCLVGHSHGGCAMTNKDTGTGRRLDVGVESFGRPISLTEIKRHLAGRTVDAQDHHGREEKS